MGVVHAFNLRRQRQEDLRILDQSKFQDSQGYIGKLFQTQGQTKSEKQTGEIYLMQPYWEKGQSDAATSPN